MEKPAQRNRTPWYVGGPMLGISIFIDFLQLILGFLLIGLFLNPLIAIFAWLIFYLWLKIRGINFTDRMASRFTIILLGGVIEMIPIVGALLPGLTLSIFALIVIARHEDKAYNEQQQKEFESETAQMAQKQKRAAEQEYGKMIEKMETAQLNNNEAYISQKVTI